MLGKSMQQELEAIGHVAFTIKKQGEVFSVIFLGHHHDAYKCPGLCPCGGLNNNGPHRLIHLNQGVALPWTD